MTNYADRFEEGVARIKRLGSRYTGFKFYLLILLCSFIASLLWTAHNVDALPPLNILLTANWVEYLWAFWISHRWPFFIFVLLYSVVLLVNILEGAFEKRVIALPPLSDEDDRTKRTFRRLNRYMTIALFFAFILTVPVIHLWLPIWYSAAAFLIGLGSAIMSAWFSLALPTSKRYIERLGQYRFRGTPSFNTASMGAEAIEVKRELSHYERIREVSPISAKVLDYLRNGDDNYIWQGFHQFYEKLATLLDVPSLWITTHRNTTKAIRYALSLCVNEYTHIVATDLEYGSVLETISVIAPADRISILNLRDSHIANRMDYRAVVDALAEELNNLFSKEGPETRFVVVLSHVTYLTGAVLDIQRFRQKVKIDESRLVVIIDGAQAVGNIEVSREMIELCDFYASSGHKWLLGKTTLGILIHVPERIYRKLQINLKQVRERTVPFSYIDYDVSENYSGETVDIEQMVSLNAMLVEFNSISQRPLAEHNRNLAQLFCNLAIRIRGIAIISSPVQSGIVSLRVRDAKNISEVLEAHYDFVGQAIDPDILRFSFHYYMDQRDVYALVEALSDIVKRSQKYMMR